MVLSDPNFVVLFKKKRPESGCVTQGTLGVTEELSHLNKLMVYFLDVDSENVNLAEWSNSARSLGSTPLFLR